VRRRIATAALVIAWLCANGALWDAMQVAAWGKMFAGYSESMSITQALSVTFDGSKPCEMCSGIAKAKETATKQMPATERQAAAKFVLAIHTVETPVFVNELDDWTMSPPLGIRERTDPVPVPPPRV
jgi:hypothetical protein